MRPRRLAALGGLALLLVGVLGYLAVAWQMAGGVTQARRKALEADPSSVGLPYREVAFHPRGDPSLTLRGWRIRPPGEQAVVILVHGVDSNRADPGVGYLELARGLAERCIGVLLFDLRGHGESGGTQVSGGYFERYDALGAFDLLVQEGVPPERIGLLGVSLGGAIALLAAAMEPRIQAVVADSAFARLTDLIVQEVRRRTDLPDALVPLFVPGMVGMARLRFGIDIQALAPEEAVARLAYPILVIHGTEDDRIPPEHGRRLARASPHPETALWLVAGAEHARTFRTAPEEYLERVARYLAARLGVAPRCPAVGR